MRLLVAALVCAASAGVPTASRAFCDAVFTGDFEAVTLSINNGVDVDGNAVDVDFFCPTQKGSTNPLLHIASYQGHTKIVKELLSRGADATAEDSKGYSALFSAARQNHGDIVSLLLAEADPLHSILTTGWSPLHVAAGRGSTESLEILLADGRLPVNGRTDDGETPLYWAANKGSIGAVEALLRHGAFASIRTDEDMSPLYAAAKNDHGDVVRRLLEVVDPRRSTIKDGQSCLHAAAAEGSNAALEILLADGRLPINDLQTFADPLWVAAERGQLASVKILRAHGADATIAFNGKTPADIASQNGHDEVVAALLKDAERDPASEAFCDAARRGDAKAVEKSIRNGVDVDHLCPVEPRGTCTALYVASGHGNPDLIRSLLREGANVDLKGCSDPELSGRTPLHVAAAHGLTENCQLLLRAGANAELAEMNSWTPLHFAAAYGHLRVVKLLLDKAKVDINGGDSIGRVPIYLAAMNGHGEVVSHLLSRGADANIADAKGIHPLYMAVEMSNTDVVQVLLGVVDPRGSTWEGSSPLHIASCKNNTAPLEALLDDGRLLINDRNKEGRTPLWFGARCGSQRAVELLMGSGADASIADKYGDAPADVASMIGYHKILALLEKHGFAPEAKARSRPGRDRQAKWLLDKIATALSSTGNYFLQVLLAFGIAFMGGIVALLITRLFFRPLWDYLCKLYWKRQKKAATRRAIRDRVMRRAQPTTEPADEPQAEPAPTPAEPRAPPEPVQRPNPRAPTVRRRRPRDSEAAAARAARNEAALARARDAREAREARDRERRDATAAALAREREARERDAAAARAREEREREAREAARERKAAARRDREARARAAEEARAREREAARERDAAAAALAREREAWEREARENEAWVQEELELEAHQEAWERETREAREREAAAALEAAREREAAEREVAARQRDEEAARAAAAAAETKSEEPLGREESKSELAPEGYEIVARVLEHLGEPHLLSTFEAQQIDDAALPFLEPSDLLDLGVAPMTCLAILGAAAASGKDKKLEAEDILHDVATHQSAIEQELREHRAEIERLKIQRREVPDEYCCPITCELMKDPVLCMEDGQTYERCAIEQWFSRPGAKTSPSTGATLASTTLAPNYALKSLIAGWKAQRSRARD